MAKLVAYLGLKNTIGLAERLTMQVLDRQDQGTGHKWGRETADAFKACFSGIQDMDLPEGVKD
jgi:hypothetical protein